MIFRMRAGRVALRRLVVEPPFSAKVVNMACGEILEAKKNQHRQEDGV